LRNTPDSKEVIDMSVEEKRNLIAEGQASYRRWKEELAADPEYQAVYAEEAAKKELWLQLVEARRAAGLTQADLAQRLGVSQAQVARVEKRGYDSLTLNSLRRYVAALGDGFALEVTIRRPEPTTDRPMADPVARQPESLSLHR
jgi:DNA-binding XRE family transcriptional regulator